MIKTKLRGLVAATHTPFFPDGSLNLAVIEKLAAHLLENRVGTAFIGGTTGESSSLTLEERRALAARWMEVTRHSALKVIVHVGANCLADSRVLAEQARQLGASGIGAVAPSYFKPGTVALLVQSMAEIAAAAPETPFYYYDIQSLTGLTLAPSAFLEQARDRIPNLAGVKFSSSNLTEYQVCLALDEGRFDVPFGVDEMLLAALALGGTSAVGSTYNFAAPIYHRLIQAFAAGDFAAARTEQFRSVRIVSLLAARGYMASAKAVMKMLGVEVGPARLPNGNLTSDQETALKRELESLRFFEWLRTG
jgi:N-acetylneuraminate lyase